MPVLPGLLVFVPGLGPLSELSLPAQAPHPKRSQAGPSPPSVSASEWPRPASSVLSCSPGCCGTPSLRTAALGPSGPFQKTQEHVSSCAHCILRVCACAGVHRNTSRPLAFQAEESWVDSRTPGRCSRVLPGPRTRSRSQLARPHRPVPLAELLGPAWAGPPPTEDGQGLEPWTQGGSPQRDIRVG